jgi:hypothetical protein
MPNSKPISRLSNNRSKSRPKQRSSSKNASVNPIPATTKYRALEEKLKRVNAEKSEVVAKYNNLLLNQAIPTDLYIYNQPNQPAQLIQPYKRLSTKSKQRRKKNQ